MILLLLTTLGYLLGSIPFGWLVAKSHGVNIQKRGSGNIGFANVRRVLGWQAGIATLIGDIAKGFVPVYIALALDYQDAAFLPGLAAIVGHLYPIWLRGKGGKGIATGLGVLIALEPLAALAGAVMYVIGGIVIKKSSTASLAGIVVAVCLGTYLEPSAWYQYITLLCIAGWTLRHNIRGTVPNYDI